MTMITNGKCVTPDGDPEVKTEVAVLLESGQAATCAMVRLELWNGARGHHERRVIRDLEISAEVRRGACSLARAAQKDGQTIPAADLLVAACASHHGVEILHDDAHIAAIQSMPRD